MFWGLRENNTTMLEKAMMKSIFVAIGDSSGNLRANIINRRSIMQVEEVARERPAPAIPASGEPEEEFNHILVNTNTDTGVSYIFLDRTMFEDMGQEEIDELVYQYYDQIDMETTSTQKINMLDEDGDVVELNAFVNAESYIAEGKEEPPEEEPEGESCSSDKAKQKASQAMEEAKKEADHAADAQEEERESMSEADKVNHPKYSTSNAKFQQDLETSSSPSRFKSNHDGPMTNKDIKQVHAVEAILEHAIAGDHGGKSNSIMPAKRLNMRNIITEASDKEYITTKGDEGKEIKLNLIIDRSGSMHGSPIYNSNIMVQALNNLAFKYPELDASILLSTTGSNFKFDLPVDNPDSPQIWNLSNTGGAEGLHVTMTEHFARLKESDVNLVYTDGSIQDEAIDKKYMESQEIELVGLYTNEEFTEETLMKHYEKCSKYFTKTIIRKDALSLVNELANMLYLTKHTG